MATRTQVAHGTYAGYTIGGCRCPRCRQAMSRYNKRRGMLIERGEWQPWAEAEPVRQHVAALRAAGLSLGSIAGKADVAQCSVQALTASGRPRIRADVARKLLSVKLGPDGLAPQAKMDATGTRRRLQALFFAGWTITYLAERVGVARSAINRLMRHNQVRVSTATVVRAVYEELLTQTPPTATRYERMNVTRTRRYALARGWVSALAWDNIDNPDETPKGVTVRTAQELHAALDEHRSRLDLKWVDIAADLEVTTESLRLLKTAQASPSVCERVEAWLEER